MGQIIKLGFKRKHSCVLEDLVYSMEQQINHALKLQLLTREDLKASVESPKPFANQFPSSCHNCCRSFSDRHSYEQQTKQISLAEEAGQIVEYRACECGSSLILSAPCRREPQGLAGEFRIYFDICVHRLMSENDFSQKDAEDLVRLVFQEVLAGFSLTKYQVC